MAFVPEDGSGKADANSLCTVEFADGYFAERRVTAWTGSVEDKQARLIRATDYVEMRFGTKFYGSRQYTAMPPQALSFPRLDIGQNGIVPMAVQKAVAEYALRATDGVALAPDPTVDNSAGKVASVRKKVGPIETETTYQAGGATATSLFKAYPAADALLDPYVRKGGGVIRA